PERIVSSGDNMTANRRQSPEIRAQMFDVQLLDVFAEVEWLLRSGREVQSDALQLRSAASTSGTDRRAATRRIQKRVNQMQKEGRTVGKVLQALADRTVELRAAVDNRHRRRRDDEAKRRSARSS